MPERRTKETATIESSLAFGERAVAGPMSSAMRQPTNIGGITKPMSPNVLTLSTDYEKKILLDGDSPHFNNNNNTRVAMYKNVIVRAMLLRYLRHRPPAAKSMDIKPTEKTRTGRSTNNNYTRV